MKFILDNIEKVTTYINQDTIKKFYYIGPVENSTKNDFLNIDISNIFKSKHVLIKENSYIEFKNGKKLKCFYFDSIVSDNNMSTNNHSIFLFSNIYMEKKGKVVIRTIAKYKFKVWINNRLVTINNQLNEENWKINISELEEGNNLIFIELFSNQFTLSNFMVLINKYDNNYNENGLMSDFIKYKIKNKFDIICNNNINNPSILEFMIIPKGLNNINKVSIQIKNEKEKIYNECFVEIFKKYTIDMNKIGILTSDNIFLIINIVHSKDIYPVLLKDVKTVYQDFKSQYKKLNKYLSNEDIINIESRLENITNYNPTFFKEIQLYENVNELIEIFNYINSNLHYKDIMNINSKGSNYYKSKLDNNFEKYKIVLPTNYDSNKKYPLIISLPTSYTSSFHDFIDIQNNGEFFMAEITIKGVTCGSYIGEAFFLEGLDLIFNNYNIDRDRVYLVGYSNGAFASWAFAQIYPDLFAAVCTIGGMPYEANFNNLDNIAILDILAEEDLEKYGENLKNKMNMHNEYSRIILKGHIHNSINEVIYSKYIKDWLLSHKRNENPKKIYYRTEKIRHNRAYWIEVIDLDEGQKYCEITGDILDDFNIKINTKNIYSFIIKLTKRINKKNLNVEINNCKFVFNNITEDILFFKKQGVSFASFDNSNNFNIKNKYLGMGILDVYMDSLKIVIPSEYNSEDEKDTIDKLAYRLASPQTHGNNSKLYVNYPIIYDSNITAKDIYNNNLIIIGVNNRIISKVLNNIIVKIESELLNTNSDYCVMTIKNNMINKEKSILLVYATDYLMYKKCLFTRSIKFPTYSNGVDPFLNSNTIIFDGKNYTTIDY